jgi:hypothetical protein
MDPRIPIQVGSICHLVIVCSVGCLKKNSWLTLTRPWVFGPKRLDTI